MGFGVPLDHWFRNELKDYAREVLLDPQTLGRGYFRAEAVRRLWDDHQQGRFDHQRPALGAVGLGAMAPAVGGRKPRIRDSSVPINWHNLVIWAI